MISYCGSIECKFIKTHENVKQNCQVTEAASDFGMVKYSSLRGTVGLIETGLSLFKGSLILSPVLNKGFSVTLECCIGIRAPDYFG